MSITALTEMSNRYGMGTDYALAGGGNTSYKDETTLFVKGSGTALRTIVPEQFVAMDRQKLKQMLSASYPAGDDAREAAALADMMAARLPGEEHKRPSVEAILHGIFPHKYVLHTHPALVNGLSCSQQGEAKCRELFGDKVVWIPLTKPGYILSLACTAAFSEREQKTGAFPQIVILQNHGIFVAADTVEEIDAMMAEVMGKLGAQAADKPDLSDAPYDAEKACAIAPALRMLYAGDGNAVAVFCGNKLAQGFAASREAVKPLTGPFTPDHIVYCKGTPLFLAESDDIRAAFEAFVAEQGYAPKIAVAQGLGFFALGKNKKEADIAMLLFTDAMKVATYARAFGGELALTPAFTQFILNWEIESYRQKVALTGASPKRLEGKIALVTGSAQGFGKGIAESMAAEGAYVVVADLNGDGAAACAGELSAAHGDGAAISVQANVAQEESAQAMVQAAVLGYGGLDILVSNAGIVIAGDLTEQTKDKFELVTSVNYTGYFLCVKYASVPMKIQHRYRPGYFMDIIEINSKSGLIGSNKNFAYAGSKFGGVGLTQSFALELVEFGIKVNAICPGNLLDGPLWSDPVKGLFKQYLDSGKVPGAKNVADVRAFYESKVPMKKGCTVPDVVCAILYAVDQKGETGQAIPVTGGQVMLK